MIKRILMVIVAAGSLFALAPRADAGIYFGRVPPVRRVAARAVLPPYPVARRVVAAPVVGPVIGPVYRPFVRPIYGPVIGGPVVYGPGVSVVVGF